MKFTYRGTGDQVFEGPDKSLGVLTEFDNGELRSLKSALKIPKIDDLDMFETSIAYYVLSIRRTDHALMPFAKWSSLKIADFRIAPHDVVALDDDGDCAECGQPVDAKFHTGVQLPPTTPTPDAAGEPAPTTPPVDETL